MPADVQAVREKVAAILAAQTDVAVDDDGDLSVQVGEGRGFVRVMPHPNGEVTLVIAFSPVVLDVELTPALFEFLARNGDALIFGHLVLEVDEGSDRGVVLIMHKLLGESVDANQLIYALYGVATSAVEIGEQMHAAFGGQRLIDL